VVVVDSGPLPDYFNKKVNTKPRSHNCHIGSAALLGRAAK